MAATVVRIKNQQFAQRLSVLEEKVAELQAKLDDLVPEQEEIPAELLIPLDDPIAEKERIIALLKAKGMLAEPGLYIREGAARWEALSEEEKRAHVSLWTPLN